MTKAHGDIISITYFHGRWRCPADISISIDALQPELIVLLVTRPWGGLRLFFQRDSAKDGAHSVPYRPALCLVPWFISIWFMCRASGH